MKNVKSSYNINSILGSILFLIQKNAVYTKFRRIGKNLILYIFFNSDKFY
jgi:hypothetical protein